MRKYVWIIISIFFVFQSLIAKAQNNSFRKYDMEDGLNQNIVQDVVQDKYGYLWVATLQGLNRFDGYEFESFINNHDDTNGFRFSFVRKLFIDNKGDIISISSRKMMLYDYLEEKFKYYNIFDKDIEFYTRIQEVEQIVQDNEGYIWSSFRQAGIFCYNTESNEYKQLKLQDTLGITFYQTYNFILDNKDHLWIHALKGDQLYSVSIDIKSFHKTGSFNYKLFPLDKVTINDDNDVKYFLSNNTLFLQYESKYMYTWDTQNKEWHVLFSYADTNSASLLDTEDIEFDDEYYWFGTKNDGIYLLNKDLKICKHIVATEKKGGLNNKKIRCLLRDQEKGMWVGTENGLYYTNLNMNAFHEISKEKGNLPEHQISAMTIDSNQNIWVATSKGISVLTDKGKPVEFFKDMENFQHLHLSNVSSLLFYKEDIVFVGSSGLQKINLAKDIYQYKHPDPEYLSENSYGHWVTWQIHRGKATGNIWFGTMGGLSMLVPKQYPQNKSRQMTVMPEEFFTYRLKMSDSLRFHSNRIWCVHETHDSILWIGTARGITRFDIKTGVFKIIEFDPDKKTSLLSGSVKAIYEDQNDRIWVGTEGGGLANIDPETGEAIKTYTMTNGLCNNHILGILEDNQGNLWISTLNGLSKFDPSKEIFMNYYQSHGLTSSEFIRNACFKAKDGTLYWGTRRGITYFKPEEIVKDENPPYIVISGLDLFNKPVSVGQEINGDVILVKSIRQTKKLKFSHKNNVITIKFTGIHFPAPEKVTYEYKLEGFDKDWIKTNSNRRFAHYTNLPAGEYFFRVRAANYDGVWCDDEASMVLVTVKPPFWETWWFRFMMITALVLLVLSGWKWRIQNLKKRQAELEKEVAERTEEIRGKNEELKSQAERLAENNLELKNQKEEIEAQSEELATTMEELHETNEELQKLNATKDKFFSIIAHDLKNPFQAINGFSSLLYRNYSSLEEKKILEFISMIKQSSKSASDLLNNLLTWSRSQTGNVEYKPKPIRLKEIVDETINLLKVNAANKSIQLQSKVHENTIGYCDANMVTTVIRNLINNAIKFTPENGSVIVEIVEHEENIELSVSDTGVGMTADVMDKLFKIEQQISMKGTSGEGGTGLGLIICKEFIEKSGGGIRVESQIGKGSKFTFTLPLANM